MKDQIYYRFAKLELTQFATFEANYTDDEKPLELSNSFKFAYNSDDDVVCCTTTIVISKETSPILKAELNSFFSIQSESASCMTEDNCVVLPTELMTQFASLGYGSMRGIIYAKTMGTQLEKIILPPNDLQNIFATPAKFRR